MESGDPKPELEDPHKTGGADPDALRGPRPIALRSVVLYSIDAPSSRLPIHHLLRLRLGFAPTGVRMGRPNDNLITLANHPPGPLLVEKVARDPNREGMF